VGICSEQKNFWHLEHLLAQDLHKNLVHSPFQKLLLLHLANGLANPQFAQNLLSLSAFALCASKALCIITALVISPISEYNKVYYLSVAKLLGYG
jgi:hypothetical protein